MNRMKIGDRVFIHGYVDEIRKDTVIVRNKGGYFGTVRSEVITGELVRCPECEYWDERQIRCNKHKDSMMYGVHDFCSKGKRKGTDE